MSNKPQLMQGNEACVMGALYAGMNFFAGYPITPSTEIAELSALYLPKRGGHFIQMEDEIGGIAAAIGASIAGAKSMTATSGPGFSLKQENIGYAAIAQIPLVIVNVMRGGPSTGLPTQSAQGDLYQAKYGSHGDYPMIALMPDSVRETFELTVRAFSFAEKYRTPVMILTDEVIGHMRERIEVPEEGELAVFNRLQPKEGVKHVPYKVQTNFGDIVPRMAVFGDGHRTHTTGLFYNENGFPSNSTENAKKLLDQLFSKINDNLKDIVMVENYQTDDAEVVILSFGSSSRSAREAVDQLREKGKKVGLFRPKTIWPSAEREIRALTKTARHILVAEMNLGQYVNEVQRIVKGTAKVHHIGRANGEILTPNEIARKAEELLYE